MAWIERFTCDIADEVQGGHHINCQCPQCNATARRRVVEVVVTAAALGESDFAQAIRDNSLAIDTYDPKAGPEFTVLGDWSDD